MGREKISWVVDVGTKTSDDSFSIAKDTFVLMLVAINGRWKLPIGYFFVDGISGEQRCNLVLRAASLANEKGAHIVGITCDGAASNLSMLRSLGCKLELAELDASFPHPITKKPIFTLLDHCRMLKLLRNTLCDKKTVISPGETIMWKHIEKLHEVQYSEGLHLANKQRQVHANWKKQSMKVSLAAQTFSQSVADVTGECRERKLWKFRNSARTEEFIRHVNDAFDIY